MNVTFLAVGGLIGKELQDEYDLCFCLGVRAGILLSSSSSSSTPW